MSMENDTRIAMMYMHNEAKRRNSRARKSRRPRVATPDTVALMSAFALTLFTRGA